MGNQSSEKHVQDLAIESAVLTDCIRLIEGFSDFLYFNYLLNVLLVERLGSIKSAKSTSEASFDTLTGSLASILNSLGTWLREAEQTNRFESKKKSLSRSFLFLTMVPKRKELIKFLDEANRILGISQKLKICQFALSSTKHFYFMKIMSLPNIPKNRTISLIYSYCGSCGWDNPHYLIGLPDSARTYIEEQTNDIHLKSPFEINNVFKWDAQVKTGQRKLVVIDIDTALTNAYLRYGRNLLLAFHKHQKDSLTKAVGSISNLLYFLESAEEKPLPSSSMFEFDRKINFSTVLGIIRAGQFQQQHQKYFAVGEIPGDIEKRRFYINFPSDFTVFSATDNFVRISEYERSPVSFALKHDEERKHSIRAVGARRIISILEGIDLELLFERMAEKAKQMGVEVAKGAKEPAIVLAFSYMVAQLLESSDLTSAIAGALTTTLVWYITSHFERTRT